LFFVLASHHIILFALSDEYPRAYARGHLLIWIEPV